MFSENEKKLLKELVKKELEEYSKEEKTIRPDFPDILKLDESYEEFLKKLLEKVE